MSWTIELLKMADTTSAAPANASMVTPITSDFENPNTAIETPQPMTATITAMPCRLTERTHPEVNAPRSAPIPGAAYSRPTVNASPP